MRAATDEIRLIRRDNNGPAVGVSGITITRESDSAAATIYTTRGGSTTIPQSSLTTDQDGYVVQPGGASAFVDLGDYLVQAAGSRAIHWDVTGGAVNSVVGGVGDVWSVPGPVFNVQDSAFAGGADPDTGSDAMPAFAAASLAALDEGQGTIFLPGGRYRWSALSSMAGITRHMIINSDKVRLVGEGSGVTTIVFDGDPGAGGVVTEALSIFGWAKGVTTGTIGSDWPTRSWRGQTVYPIAGANPGDEGITLTTHADAANFVPGDIATLLTGAQGRITTPDAELVIIKSASASTGVVTFTRPLTKKYVQEYVASAAVLSGASNGFSARNSATYGTTYPCPIGLVKVTGSIIQDVAVKGITFEGSPGAGAAIRYYGLYGLIVEDVKCRGGATGLNGQQAYDYTIRDLDIDAVGQVPVGQSWGCVEGFWEQVRIRSQTDNAYFEGTEGSSNWTARDLVIRSSPSSPSDLRAVSAGKRNRNCLIDGLHIEAHPAGSAIDLSTDTETPEINGSNLIDHVIVENCPGPPIRFLGVGWRPGRSIITDPTNPPLTRGLTDHGDQQPRAVETVPVQFGYADAGGNITIGTVPDNAELLGIVVNQLEIPNGGATNRFDSGYNGSDQAIVLNADLTLYGWTGFLPLPQTNLGRHDFDLVVTVKYRYTGSVPSAGKWRASVVYLPWQPDPIT